MDTTRIIRGTINSMGCTVTSAITQWDYGWIFIPEFEDIPATYRLDFSNDEHHGMAIPVYCDSAGAEVPKELIDTGRDIYVWYYFVGDGYGRTEYKWKIPNRCKPRSCNVDVTPSQQSSIDQLIAKSNTIISTAEESARSAEESAEFLQNASAAATTLPEDSEATAELNEGVFSFGIPRGERGEPGPAGDPGAKGDPGTKGDPGKGIDSVVKTGTSGAVDTYTITYTDGTTSAFTVTNGHIDNVDPTLSIAGYAADAAKVGDLKEGLTNIRTEKHTDLLYGKTAVDKWFVRPATGEGEVLNSFYSYLNIDIPDGVAILWPFNNFSEDDYIRSICFYDANEDFISGVSGNNSTVIYGVPVPSGAKKLSCSLSKPTTGYDGKHYLSTVIGGDVVNYPLEDDVTIKADQIDYNKSLSNNVRIPCINFQFDDGATKDADIVDIFDTFGFKCAFALISNISAGSVFRYLGWQNNGYEILSHSTDSTGMNDTTVDPSVIETKLKESKERLEALGFKIRGFVTPNSTMALAFKPILRKYYQFAETVYFGDYTGTGKAYMEPIDGVFNGFRVSLQGTTLANQKAAVDACIENYGCLTFYGHAATLDTTNNLTTENLTALLTYINTKVANGECIVGTPSEVKEPYFAVRNDDISDGWIDFDEQNVGLDSRLEKIAWFCSYNPKLKLASINIRLKATEAISGQFYICTDLPFAAKEGVLLQNNFNRDCITYNRTGILLNGSNTWTSGASYRFTALLKTD